MLNRLLFVVGFLVSLTAVLGFAIHYTQKPFPHFHSETVVVNQPFLLSNLYTEATKYGSFQTELLLSKNAIPQTDNFLGLEISIDHPTSFDRIMVGINKYSEIEFSLWQKDSLLLLRKKALPTDVQLNQPLTLLVSGYDATYKKYRGNSAIHARLYSNSGFFGDVVTLAQPLSDYGSFIGNKNITVLGESSVFDAFSIWSDWNSLD